jgi:hypothetical protein
MCAPKLIFSKINYLFVIKVYFLAQNKTKQNETSYVQEIEIERENFKHNNKYKKTIIMFQTLLCFCLLEATKHCTLSAAALLGEGMFNTK